MKKIGLLIMFCLVSCILEAEEKKVALLFITRSDLNHTNLWKGWINPKKYNVYNHSKFTVSDPWFSQYRIAEYQPNEWGHILLVQQALLREALKDPSNHKFVLLSESCVPLRTPNHVHKILTQDDNSYMRWYNIWWSHEPTRMLLDFPPEHHWGHHTWLILNRKHAEMIVNDDYWILLANVRAVSDESYASTFFSMCGVLHEFKNELTTYVDWLRGNPYLFKEAAEENIRLLTDAKFNPIGSFGPRCCLFARKIAAEFPDCELNKIIYQENWIQN